MFFFSLKACVWSRQPGAGWRHFDDTETQSYIPLREQFHVLNTIASYRTIIGLNPSILQVACKQASNGVVRPPGRSQHKQALVDANNYAYIYGKNVASVTKCKTADVKSCHALPACCTSWVWGNRQLKLKLKLNLNGICIWFQVWNSLLCLDAFGVFAMLLELRSFENCAG